MVNSDPLHTVHAIRSVRQVRQYHSDPVPDAVLQALLEVARWTGSSRNSQPWHFILVKDKDALKIMSEARAAINWLADVPVAIALAMDGVNSESEGYDEGRVTERLLIAATLLGYGGGTAWFFGDSQREIARTTLGVPDGKVVRSIVAIGRPVTTLVQQPTSEILGRKPIAELVSYERFGQTAP